MVLELGLGDFFPKQGAQLLWLKVALRLIHLPPSSYLLSFILAVGKLEKRGLQTTCQEYVCEQGKARSVELPLSHLGASRQLGFG